MNSWPYVDILIPYYQSKPILIRKKTSHFIPLQSCQMTEKEVFINSNFMEEEFFCFIFGFAKIPWTLLFKTKSFALGFLFFCLMPNSVFLLSSCYRLSSSLIQTDVVHLLIDFLLFYNLTSLLYWVMHDNKFTLKHI